MIPIRKRASPTQTSKKSRNSSNNTVLIVFFLLICGIVVVVGLFALNTPTESNQPVDEGKDFVFESLDGDEVHLSDYRGKIVILDLWATWCSPCQFQMTELKKIYDYYSRDQVEIFSVDIDDSETPQQIQSFIDEFKTQLDIELNWIFGIDDGSIWEEYMINGGIPTLCIFDQQGSLQFQHEGVAVFSDIPQGLPEDTQTLDKIINDLL